MGYQTGSPCEQQGSILSPKGHRVSLSPREEGAGVFIHQCLSVMDWGLIHSPPADQSTGRAGPTTRDRLPQEKKHRHGHVRLACPETAWAEGTRAGPPQCLLRPHRLCSQSLLHTYLSCSSRKSDEKLRLWSEADWTSRSSSVAFYVMTWATGSSVKHGSCVFEGVSDIIPVPCLRDTLKETPLTHKGNADK